MNPLCYYAGRQGPIAEAVASGSTRLSKPGGSHRFPARACMIMAATLACMAPTAAGQRDAAEPLPPEVEAAILEIQMELNVGRPRLHRVGRAQPENGQSTPASTAASGPHGHTLTFADGQVLNGELIGLNDGLLHWQSPLFEEVAELDQRAISAIGISEARNEFSFEDPMVVSFKDGGRLYGDLVAINGRDIVVESRRVGTVTLHRDQVSSLQWLRQGDLLWSGPHGTTGWTYQRPPQEGGAWNALPGGRMRTVGWHQDTQLKLDLPGMFEVELTLEADDALRFELQLEVDGESGGIATWGDELVLLRGEDFVSLGSYDPESPLTLRWFWDRARERGLVTDAVGNPLGQWQADASRAGQMEELETGSRVYLSPRTGNDRADAESSTSAPENEDPFLLPEFAAVSGTFNLKNRGPSLTLTSFQVRKWSGDDPQPRGVDLAEGARVMLAGDQTVALPEGTDLKVSDGHIRIHANGRAAGAEAQVFELNQVEGIWLQGSAQPVVEPTSEPVSLRFADGTWWQGTVESITGNELLISTAYSGQPFKADISDLVELNFLQQADEDWLSAHTGGEDRLTIESNSLIGTWQPAAGDKARWLLPGAIKAVPVATRHQHEITRPLDAEARRLQTALLHLTDGQILPGQVQSIAANGGSVVLKSDLLDELTLSSEQIRALQFPGEQLLIDGFNDGGWHVSAGTEEEHVLFEQGPSGREVTLKSGGGFAHPGILLTNHFNFTMAITPRGSLRVRLFDEPGALDSMAIVLAQTNNQLHCGFETERNSFSSQGSLALAGDDPLNVGFSWDEQHVFVHVNDELVATIDHSQAANPGRYLGLETSDLWRSTDSQVRISGFSLDPDHGMSSVPLVNRQAREEALLLPRFLRDDPPRQVLLAHNGDLLRGTIEGGDQTGFRFRTGLRSYQVPSERTAAIIWLAPADDVQAEPAVDDKPDRAAREEDSGSKPAAYTVLLHAGAAVLVEVESFGPEMIEGTVAGIGPCRIPVELVAEIQSGDRQLAERSSLFAGWQLQKTPDPLPIAAGQDGRTGPLVGESAPQFELPLLAAAADEEEVMFNLADHSGRIVVLDFWASWCAVCVRSLPEKIEAFSGFDPEKVTFLAVNQAEGADLVRWFLESRGWDDMKVAMDRDQAVGRSFQVGGLPHSVIIGPDGRIAWVSTGFRAGGSRALVEVVESLLTDAAPDA